MEENKRSIGNSKEELVIDYLKNKGYFIIQKNYRVRQGEIDIIARDRGTIVFIEVKYRSSMKNGHPLEAVTYNKQKQICKISLFFMNQNKISPDNTPIRYDVIGVLGDEITHIENAFEYVG